MIRFLIGSNVYLLLSYCTAVLLASLISLTEFTVQTIELSFFLKFSKVGIDFPFSAKKFPPAKCVFLNLCEKGS